MNIIGIRTVKISSLRLPGDMDARQKTARVQQLAASFQHTPLLNAVIVRYVNATDRTNSLLNAKHNTLLAGRDRVAGKMLRGDVDIEAKLIECDDEEARAIELTENAYRRHDKAEQKEALAELERVLAVTEERLIEEMGRQPTRREIHTAAAPALGVLPETVARKEREVKATNGKRKAPSDLQTWGLELDEAYAGKLAQVTASMEALARALTAAQAASAFLQDNDIVPPSLASNVRQELMGLGRMVREHVPVALCPYCKGQDELQKTCAGCVGVGWVGASKLKTAPEPLKDAFELRVVQNGNVVAMKTHEEEGWL